MSSFYEDMLSVSDCLQHLFIIFLLLHNRLFYAQILPLFSDLLLGLVILSELTQLLL